MPTYHVLLADPGGQQFRSALNAPSLPALALRLREEGHLLVRVLTPGPDRSLRGYHRRVSEGEVTTTLRNLALNLENGVPLVGALALLARETRNLTLRAVLLDLERNIAEGDSLSSALATYPLLFSPLTVRLLEAAEAGQRLPEALRQLADYSERSGQARQRIRTALVYPQVVGLFTLALLCFTLISTIPKFQELFIEMGVKELPLAARSLYWFSSTAVPWGSALLPVFLFGGWLWYRSAKRRNPFRLSHLQSRIPVLGSLYHQFALLKLTRLLASLVEGGVALPEALRLAGQGAENPLLQAAMWDAIPYVAAGETLSGAFSHAGILTPTFCGQIAAAEVSGELPQALRRLSDWYSDRVDYLAARTSAVLEPFFILSLAVLAGWVAVGVFFPMISIIKSLSGGN